MIDRVAGVIYDVDGTLLDVWPEHLKPYNMHEHSRFLAIESLKLEGLEGVTREENAQSFIDSPEHTMQGAVWTLLKNRGLVGGDVDHDHELVMKITKAKNLLYDELLKEQGKEIEGASHFVRELGKKSIGQAIASGARIEEIKTFLNMYGIQEFFPEDRVFGYGMFKNPKPHPDSFDLAFRSLGLRDEERSNVIAFEDNPKGVESAKRAGLYVCALTTEFSEGDFKIREHKPDIIVSDFHDFLGKIQDY